MTGAVEHIIRKDDKLGLLVRYIGEIETKEYDDLFRFVVCEIVGQMLSSKVKHTLVNRLLGLCGGSITPESILSVGAEKLREIGLSSAKCRYIISFAKNVCDGNIDLGSLRFLSDEDVIKELTRQLGIGNWTAKMVLLFALEREDVVPYEDVAFQQGYRWLYEVQSITRDDVLKKAKLWTPFSSLAARYIYECVNQNLIKHSTSILMNR